MVGKWRFQPCNSCCENPCTVCGEGTGPDAFDVTFAGFRDNLSITDYYYLWFNQTHRFTFYEEGEGYLPIPTSTYVDYCTWLGWKCGCTSWGYGHTMALKIATNGTWWRLGLWPLSTGLGSAQPHFLKEWSSAPTCEDLAALSVPLNSTFSSTYPVSAATASVTATTGNRSPSPNQECECAQNSSGNICRYLKVTLAGITGALGTTWNGEYTLEVDCNTEYLWYHDSLTFGVQLKIIGGTHYWHCILNPGLYVVAWRDAVAAYPNCLTVDAELANFVDGSFTGDFGGSTATIECL